MAEHIFTKALAAARKAVGLPKVMLREVARTEIKDRYTYYPITGMTPERVATIIRAAKVGNNRELLDLFEELPDRDPHIAQCIRTRKLAVTGKPWEIAAASEDDLDQEIAHTVKEAISYIDFYKTSLRDLLNAPFKGFAVAEVMWTWVDTTDSKGLPVRRIYPYALLGRPHQKFIFDDYENLRLVTDANPYPGEEFPLRKMIVHKLTRDGSVLRSGELFPVLWYYLFKTYSIQDWVRFLEVYGHPIRLGKYKAGAKPDEIEELKKAVLELATDTGAVISDATNIDFVSVSQKDSSTGGGSYDRFLSWVNAEISKMLLGQTLSHEASSKEGRGTQALGTVHEEVRQDILEADAGDLDETMNSSLVVWITELNLGAQARYPTYATQVKPEGDKLTQAKVDEIMIGKVGVKVPASYPYKQYNYPEPKEDEEILVPPMRGPQGVGMYSGPGILSMSADRGRLFPPEQLSAVAEEAGVKIYQDILEGLKKKTMSTSSTP